jgi:hypothetical protein
MLPVCVSITSAKAANYFGLGPNRANPFPMPCPLSGIAAAEDNLPGALINGAKTSPSFHRHAISSAACPLDVFGGLTSKGYVERQSGRGVAMLPAFFSFK